MKKLLFSVSVALLLGHSPLAAQKLLKVKASSREPVVKEFPTLSLHELKELHRIENRIDDVMQLSENPINGSFTVTFRLEEKEKVILSVTDPAGKTMYTKEVQAFPGSNEVEVPNLQLHNGIYILTLSTENVEAHRKIIIY